MGKIKAMLNKGLTWLKQRSGIEDGPVYTRFGPLVRKLGVSAICLWPFGIIVDPLSEKYAFSWKRKCLIAHEQNHWDWQRKTLGLWYIAYLVLLPFGKGRNHPLEKPAYEIEDRCTDPGNNPGGNS